MLVALAVVVATRNGPGLSPDSVDYVTAAHNVSRGAGFVDFTGDPVAHWTPGYPYVLAAGDVVGLDPTDAARAVNALALAATVLLAFLLLRRHVVSGVLLVAGTAAVAFNPALLQNADHVWSEALFGAISAAFALVLEDLVRKRHRRTLLIPVAALLVGCSFLVRVPGIFFAAAGGIVLAVDGWRTRDIRRAVRDIAAFGVLSSIIPIAWIVRNASVASEDVLGVRVASGLGPVDIVDRMLRSVGYWLLPEQAPSALAVIVGAIVVLVVASAILGPTREQPPAPQTTVMPLVVLVASYLVLVIVSNLVAGSDINQRIMSPMIVPTTVLTFGFFDLIARRLRTQATRAHVFTAFVVIVVVLEGILFIAIVVRHGRDPGGYGERVARSELVEVAGRTSRGGTLFSNDPWAIALADGDVQVRLAPTSLRPGMSHRPASAEDVVRAACSHSGAYLAWFSSAPSQQPPVLRLPNGSVVRVAEVARARDGTMYRVEKASERCRP